MSFTQTFENFGMPIQLPLPSKLMNIEQVEVCNPEPSFFIDENLLMQYWLWDLKYPTQQNTLNEIHQELPAYSQTAKTKPKKDLMLKHGQFENKADTLLRILQSITSTNVTLVTAKKKAESRRGPMSSKRSTYIGVSRNGPHWQALITIKKRKTYIGSYRTEEEAAIAFDFFSLLLHSLTAKTNFNYTKEDIVGMIYNFKENDECFKPELLRSLSHFVSQ